MEEVVKKVEEFSKTPEFNYYFSKENYDKNMHKYDLEKAEEKGHATGFIEGKTENTLEIAKNLLSIGISIKDIMTATGLSEKEIKALKTQD